MPCTLAVAAAIALAVVAYRRPLEGPSAKLFGDLRIRAAAALDAFAAGECP